MRKTQMALAAVALVASTAALAQVSLYGTVDSSITGGSGANARFEGAGNWGTSSYGLKGSEDLGGGMKAGFQLESGLNIGNGGFANGGLSGTSRLFNRQANVSVGGDFGTVKLGLQLSPFIAGSAGGYVSGNNTFLVRSLVMSSASDGGSGTDAIGDATGSTLATGGFFIPNAVSYSVAAGGVSASVLGQISNGTAANEYTAATAGTSFGDVSVNASYQNRGGTGAAAYTSYNLNAAASIAGLKVAGGYTNHDPKTGTTVNHYNIGALYPVTESLAANIQYASATGAKSLINIGAQYSLSKSTFLYALVSQAKGTAPLYAGGPTASDTATRTGYAVGVSHSF